MVCIILSKSVKFLMVVRKISGVRLRGVVNLLKKCLFLYDFLRIFYFVFVLIYTEYYL